MDQIFLLFRDAAVSDRRLILREAREDYEALRNRYLQFVKHPEQLTELSLDPLADDPESPWDSFRRDEAVRVEILQDVRRLPDDPLYHQEQIQTLILDVLFVFCKHNPDAGGYRQGMHELLAPVVYVLHDDAIEHSAASATPLDTTDEAMAEMLDARFIEHDAYVLFSKIMDRARNFYEINKSSSSSASGDDGSAVHTNRLLFPPNELSPFLASSHSAGGVEESAIVKMSKEIHETTLMQVDPELATHLKNIEILPQIFLIRWIRLLFGREFPFQQHLALWDNIFAFDPHLDLVPLICVAMLLRIRWELLDADYSVALQSLLQYPPFQPPHGPTSLVDDALFLRDHLNPPGGANLVLKYTGRSPARVPSPSATPSSSGASRPSTPSAAFAAGLGSLRNRTLRATRFPLQAPRRASGSREDNRAETRAASATATATTADQLPTASPSRKLIQSRESMEALFQGAAKGVLERGEKLGINQAVRDAVGEIRRNMVQSFQEARQAAKATGRGRDGSGAGLPTAAPARDRALSSSSSYVVETLERRNRQLASVLSETIAALGLLAENMSKSTAAQQHEESGERDGSGLEGHTPQPQQQQQQQRQWLEAVELAAIKVQFVKAHLEDASLSLPSDELATDETVEEDTPAGLAGKRTHLHGGLRGSPTPATNANAARKSKPMADSTTSAGDTSPPPTGGTRMGGETADANRMDVDEEHPSATTTDAAAPPPPAAEPSPAGLAQHPGPSDRQGQQGQQSQQPLQSLPPPEPQRPHALPTRSTLAQSSFAWMLEPGDTAQTLRGSNGGRSSSVAAAAAAANNVSSSPSSPSSSARKPSRAHPANRGRHAFLFGEVVSQSPLGSGDNSGGGGDGVGDGRHGPSSRATKLASGRPHAVTSDEIFGLEPLRRALPNDKTSERQ
ncbi:Rab-GAP/TBC domain protein [Niveomyces insectorum RCEF 264]|uniref:Rab-GAP/TBC domain protein n=1 Tax=Niveomyces insectorum RCEF 264 TaxID=1081102 RepID=A0A167RGJ1_9HYPO|nr:Rab-GAP/TBC domain protein [Niveomyces insectorum RCEF 264]